MASTNQSLWGALIVAAATTTVAIAVNFATELKTSVLAWAAVPVLTLVAAVATDVSQRMARGERAFPLFTSPSGRRLGIGAAVLTAVAIVLSATAYWATSTAGEEAAPDQPATSGSTTVTTGSGPPASTRTTPAQPQQAQQVVQQVASYPLISSSGLCPKTDKVDLDTAQPGHGGQPQIGEYLDRCKVSGGLAELILEADEVHTPNGSRRLLPVKRGDAVDHSHCRSALRTETRYLTSTIPLRELGAADRICAQTDQGNVALVDVHEVTPAPGGESRVVIGFTVWQP